ncbi:MAG: serine hydroxymethyltransferase [Candidatus Adlerbacteria bacterium]|nr:serine hydroxymethyltransferase [Candidatus Adlerbacteria bacterium]
MNLYKHIQKQDKETYKLLLDEEKRQTEGLELIPSENIVSKAVREAMGSCLTNKYSEGYPHARYYGGNEVIDKVEDLARERAKKLFKVPHVNVQPYSGSPANFAVYLATCSPGDTIMGHLLTAGGHLTHGWKASATSMFYKAVQYGVKPDGYLDLAEIARLAKQHKPKLIWVGATAYVREFPFKELSKIADSVGAYLAADIAHIAGLVVAGAHASPVPYAHIVTTTTHKTLRGPRGGIIMVTQKGLAKDPELAQKVDRAIFPNLQGGPHDHTTAGIAVALKEAATPKFRVYGKQVVKNAKALAKALMAEGVELVSHGTDNHMLLMKCGGGRGAIVEMALDAVGLTANKNTIPNEPSSPFYPSGIRLGTPSITTRGMKEREMKIIAGWIVKAIDITAKEELPAEKSKRKAYLTVFQKRAHQNPELKTLRKEVRQLCAKFPIPDSFV